MVDQEVKYLINLIEEIKYKEWETIFISEDKYLYGIITPPHQKSNLTKWFEVKTLINSIVYLDRQIKYSFFIAIEHSYSQEIVENFNPHLPPTKRETTSYYYLENAIFRISSLWDLLAHIYNVFYEIEIPLNKINYNKFFRLQVDNQYRSSKRQIKQNLLRIKALLSPVTEYLNEKDNILIDGRWEGNHSYLNSLRNQLAHRNALAIPSCSNFSFSMKNHPTFMLKRAIEDYNTVSKFILEIAATILVEFENEMKLSQ